MTGTIDTAQPEALRIAAALEYCDASVARQAINELRNLHAANVYTSDLCTQALDEVRRLTSALAAAEARNATLTDDAARYRWLRDAKSLELTSDGMEWTRADGTKFRASHRLCAVQTAFAAYPSLDETIDAARAAASISTKGDGQ